MKEIGSTESSPVPQEEDILMVQKYHPELTKEQIKNQLKDINDFKGNVDEKLSFFLDHHPCLCNIL